VQPPRDFVGCATQGGQVMRLKQSEGFVGSEAFTGYRFIEDVRHWGLSNHR
jgi:hypothetical protein